MTNPNLWNQLLVWPLVNLLVAFYKFFEWLGLPGPLGFAIIGITIAMRVILYPLMQAQLTSAKKMSRIKPHLDALNEKHKNDKQALQQAQMALYKEHGVNPAAGCLPLLVQIPVLYGLYGVFNEVLRGGGPQTLIQEFNKIVYFPALKLTHFDLSFFGIGLGVKPAEWQKYGWWLLLIPVVTAFLQWYQTRLMLNAQPVAPAASPAKGKKLAKATEGKEEKSPQDAAMEMQKQMGLIMPIMFGYFALQFPIGLALYWNVFGIFGIMQQVAVNKSK